MIELTEQPRTSWWTLVRGKPAACGWRLLAVQLVFAVAGAGELRLRVALQGDAPRVVLDLALLVVGSLTAAWSWSAKLRVLDGGRGIPSALRPDLRRIGRLGGWLAVLDVFGLLRLFSDIDIDAYVGLVVSPLMNAVRLGYLYLLFAAALLPMAILLEGRGIGRAFRLSHGRGLTVLRVLPVVLLSGLVTSVLQQWQIMTLGTLPEVSSIGLVQVAALLIEVLKDVLVAVLLYAAYRGAERPQRNETQEVGLADFSGRLPAPEH